MKAKYDEIQHNIVCIISESMAYSIHRVGHGEREKQIITQRGNYYFLLQRKKL